MVSRIKRPDEKTSQIKVQSVEFSKGFLDKVRRKGKRKTINQSGMMTLDKTRVRYLMTSPVIIDTIPGDKSISHRAIIIGALANGVTHFNGFLCSDDCLNTLKIFQQLGVEIIQDGTSVTVHGRGPGALKSPSTALDVGNSGTGIRLITGALAGTEVTATISGDHSIQQRPMQRIVEPLNQMGANIVATHQKPPLMITGNPKLNSNTSYAMPVASAQVKSALLLAGVAANVPVQVIEPEACRDHTERMLNYLVQMYHQKMEPLI